MGLDQCIYKATLRCSTDVHPGKRTRHTATIQIAVPSSLLRTSRTVRVDVPDAANGPAPFVGRPGTAVLAPTMKPMRLSLHSLDGKTGNGVRIVAVTSQETEVAIT